MVLLRLPPEIIRYIFSFFAKKEYGARESLKRSRLVCKQFCKLIRENFLIFSVSSISELITNLPFSKQDIYKLNLAQARAKNITNSFMSEFKNLRILHLHSLNKNDGPLDLNLIPKTITELKIIGSSVFNSAEHILSLNSLKISKMDGFPCQIDVLKLFPKKINHLEMWSINSTSMECHDSLNTQIKHFECRFPIIPHYFLFPSTLCSFKCTSLLISHLAQRFPDGLEYLSIYGITNWNTESDLVWKNLMDNVIPDNILHISLPFDQNPHNYSRFSKLASLSLFSSGSISSYKITWPPNLKRLKINCARVTGPFTKFPTSVSTLKITFRTIDEHFLSVFPSSINHLFLDNIISNSSQSVIPQFIKKLSFLCNESPLPKMIIPPTVEIIQVFTNTKKDVKTLFETSYSDSIIRNKLKIREYEINADEEQVNFHQY